MRIAALASIWPLLACRLDGGSTDPPSATPRASPSRVATADEDPPVEAPPELEGTMQAAVELAGAYQSHDTSEYNQDAREFGPRTLELCGPYLEADGQRVPWVLVDGLVYARKPGVGLTALLRTHVWYWTVPESGVLQMQNFNGPRYERSGDAPKCSYTLTARDRDALQDLLCFATAEDFAHHNATDIGGLRRRWDMHRTCCDAGVQDSCGVAREIDDLVCGDGPSYDCTEFRKPADPR